MLENLQQYETQELFIIKGGYTGDQGHINGGEIEE